MDSAGRSPAPSTRYVSPSTRERRRPSLRTGVASFDQLLVVAADLVAVALGGFLLHRVEQLLPPGPRGAGVVGARDADRIAVLLGAAHRALLHRVAQLGQPIGGVALGGGRRLGFVAAEQVAGLSHAVAGPLELP